MGSSLELLKLAAKAAGIEYDDFDEDRGCDIWFLPDSCRYDAWNPLDDDGDAFRLAVKCRLNVLCEALLVRRPGQEPLLKIEIEGGPDQLAATRLAIVRAAAEIGKGCATATNTNQPEGAGESQ